MSFIEMTGATLERIVADDELHQGDLAAEGVNPHTIVRVNRQGDIEIRRPSGWDVIGGGEPTPSGRRRALTFSRLRNEGAGASSSGARDRRERSATGSGQKRAIP